ncbi:MAG: hypothetical protein II081_02445 [Prevotella sp.]|nr:hypothetical protein [Prevotella sp.]
MKQLKYFLIALVCTLFASCMGEDYASPNFDGSPYGNNELKETNVLTIQQLKDKYSNVINNSSMEEVTEDIQIKGIITGNDIGGNIYNEVSLQDATGALLVCIAQGGLYGPLPLGQEVLISLKGLMIGGYGQQPEIGGVYTNTKTGAQSIGRMTRYLWNSHYKLIGKADPARAEALMETFDISQMSNANYLAAHCGKLMKIKGVTLKDADGKKVYAPDDGSVALTANCANRAFAGIDQNSLVLRTSTYADFANTIMPQGEHDIVGIFTRYRNTWQILLRTIDDVKEAETFNIDDLEGSGHGTAEDPFNVARALALVSSGNHDSGAEVYVKGIISQVNEVSTQYGNATYFISDDGKTDSQLEIYRGYYINGEKFSDETKDQIKEGKKVVIAGKLTLYGETIEFTTGSKIISIE